jgi:hypothetical protein
VRFACDFTSREHPRTERQFSAGNTTKDKNDLRPTDSFLTIYGISINDRYLEKSVALLECNLIEEAFSIFQRKEFN